MAPRHEHVRLHKRKGFWYLIRRVPHEFAAYDDRRIVYLATGIRILELARLGGETPLAADDAPTHQLV